MTAEQPHSPTVHTQPLEAEHSTTPSQSSIDIHIHVLNRTVTTNKPAFPRKQLANRIARFKQKGSPTFPGLTEANRANRLAVFFICVEENERLNLRAARKKECDDGQFARIFKLVEGFGTIQGTSTF